MPDDLDKAAEKVKNEKKLPLHVWDGNGLMRSPG